RRRRGAAPPALLDSVIAVLLYGVGAAVVAHRWFGVELTLFLGTSAVVGAVVGLALQDSLGNLFAGIALHTEAPFRVGDWVKVGDRDGKVEQISWRATRLRTWDGDTLTVPNNEVARHGILNYSLPRAPHSRLVSVGVSYHTPPTRLQGALRGIDLFRPLSDDELRAAAGRFRPLHYAGGERIIEEGAPGDSFFLIDSGEVQVSKKLGGFSRELARLMEGQFFGEMALLTGEPRAATVVAAGDVDVFVLDKNGFQDIIAANPEIAVDM